MSTNGETGTFSTLRWVGDAATGYLKMVDQTLLPTEHVEIDCRDVPAVWEAIKSLRVRGAPAIGVAAAYGAVIGARSQGTDDGAAVRRALAGGHRVASNQPADGRQSVLGARPDGPLPGPGRNETTAPPCWKGCCRGPEDRQGRSLDVPLRSAGTAQPLVRPGHGVLTHCNAGGLATADYGTALAVIFAAHEQGTPRARLRRRDAAAASGRTADRLGAQGPRHSRHLDLRQHGRPGDAGRQDSDGRRRGRSNRLQRRHRQQDRNLRRGRPGPGPRHPFLRRRTFEHLRPVDSTTEPPSPSSSATRARSRTDSDARPHPTGIDVYNPAFDVTPAGLIAGIITEKGVISPVNRETIRRVLGSS